MGLVSPTLFPRTRRQSFISFFLDDGVPDDTGCHILLVPAKGHLSHLPSSANVERSPAVSRTCPVIWFRNMWFSATRYSFRNNRPWSTGPVIEGSHVFHSITPPPGHDDVPVGVEYRGSK